MSFGLSVHGGVSGQTFIPAKSVCSSVPPTRAAPTAWQPDFEKSLELLDRIIREEIKLLQSS